MPKIMEIAPLEKCGVFLLYGARYYAIIGLIMVKNLSNYPIKFVRYKTKDYV